ncbi:MAG: phosphoserine phosphatase SerB [Ghiorsea sp.]|nr:phosphoserine phosphatase SerB [Ghiorsea sp.]
MLNSWVSESAKQAANLQLYVSVNINEQAYALIAKALNNAGLEVISADKISGGWMFGIYGQGSSGKFLSQQFRKLSEETGIDIAFVEANPVPSLKKPGILFMDMDSTLIQCECIDEIADFLGIKKDISAITQQAMEGKLDFSESLIARVKLLAGLDESVLKQVYDERIRLTDGAEKLIETVHQASWKVGLVSGGFTYFTSLLQERLNLDFVAANTLEIVDGKLTGRVLGRIVDAQVKKELLIQKSKDWGIDLAASVALGDGANDLPMLNTAGLGIAFHAKPKVRELAPYALNDGGLDQALQLLTPWEEDK